MFFEPANYLLCPGNQRETSIQFKVSKS